MTDLITADEARSKSSNYDLSADQVFARLAHVIESNASAGKNRIIQSFSVRSVSAPELEKAIIMVRAKGYIVSTMTSTTSADEVFVTVSW